MLPEEEWPPVDMSRLFRAAQTKHQLGNGSCPSGMDMPADTAFSWECTAVSAGGICRNQAVPQDKHACPAA